MYSPSQQQQSLVVSAQQLQLLLLLPQVQVLQELPQPHPPKATRTMRMRMIQRIELPPQELLKHI